VKDFEHGRAYGPRARTVKRGLPGIEVPGTDRPGPELKRSVRAQGVRTEVLNYGSAFFREIAQGTQTPTDSKGG